MTIRDGCCQRIVTLKSVIMSDKETLLSMGFAPERIDCE